MLVDKGSGRVCLYLPFLAVTRTSLVWGWGYGVGRDRGLGILPRFSYLNIFYLNYASRIGRGVLTFNGLRGVKPYWRVSPFPCCKHFCHGQATNVRSLNTELGTNVRKYPISPFAFGYSTPLKTTVANAKRTES